MFEKVDYVAKPSTKSSISINLELSLTLKPSCLSLTDTVYLNLRGNKSRITTGEFSKSLKTMHLFFHSKSYEEWDLPLTDLIYMPSVTPMKKQTQVSVCLKDTVSSNLT